MRIFQFLFLLLFFHLACGSSYAQGGLVRGAKNIMSIQAIQLARQSFVQGQLLNQVSRGLVQISRPGASEVLGTGFIFSSRQRLWVAMPYHIGGVTGSRRVIRFTGENHQLVEREISIVANGNAGWHAPDVSLAEFPPQDAPLVQPLAIGTPLLNQTAYSFGYVSGRTAGLEGILPMERYLFNAEGFGLMADRRIPGEDVENPFNISGYCGSPVVQWVDGKWRAVGLHTGSCVTEKGHTRSFAVNLPRVLPLLLNRYLKNGSGFSRDLSFRGWLIGKLLPSEKVHAVEVLRGGERIFIQLLRNYPNPYSDEHSELALGNFELLSGDEIRFEIRNNQREVRFLSHKLP